MRTTDRGRINPIGLFALKWLLDAFANVPPAPERGILPPETGPETERGIP
jgi:hypothetical protein